VSRLVTILVLACSLGLAGCLEVERLEVRIRYDESLAPVALEITYRNLSSDADEPAKLEKDFDVIVAAWRGDAHLIDRAKEGWVVKERSVYLEDGRLHGREVLIPLPDAEWMPADEMLVSGGERIAVVRRDQGAIAESNGKVLESEKNTLIVWPDSQREIFWIQDTTVGASEAKRKSLERNGIALAKRFETYLKETAEAR
jgi:hypothetical protein